MSNGTGGNLGRLVAREVVPQVPDFDCFGEAEFLFIFPYKKAWLFLPSCFPASFIPPMCGG